MPLGYEFQPDEEKRLRNNLNQPGQFSPGVSEAVKVLSLRLPQVLGGSPMAPDALLQPGMGGAGGGPGAVGQSVLNASGGGPGPSLGPSSAGPLGGGGPFAGMQPNSGAGEPAALNDLMSNALQPGKPRIHGQPDEPGLGSNPPQGPSGPGIPEPPGGQGPNFPGNNFPAGPQPSNGLHDILEFLLQRQPDRGGRQV